MDALHLIFLSWLIPAVLAGLVLGILRSTLPPSEAPPLPRIVSWNFPGVLGVLFLMVLLPALAEAGLRESGILGRLYGDATPPTSLWAAVLSAPFFVVLALLWLSAASETPAWQVGITRHRWLSALRWGYSGWVVATPVVFAVHLLTNFVQKSLGEAAQQHPLLLLFEHRQPAWFDWGILLAQAILLGPLIEELFFRGVLQPWLIARPVRALALFGFAALLGRFLYHPAIPDDSPAFVQGVLKLLPELLTVLAFGLFLALAPLRRTLYAVQVRVNHRLGRPAGRPASLAMMQGIVSGAFLFGMFHAAIWPTPVPLFVLGIFLGYVAYRTQSLWGCLLLHAMFNSISCLMLVFGVERLG